MEKLSTIQKRDNLNTVFRNGEPGPGGAFHEYQVVQYLPDESALVSVFHFQKGPRNEPSSEPGVLDVDLLEIVRDRLKCFPVWRVRHSGKCLCPDAHRGSSDVDE